MWVVVLERGQFKRMFGPFENILIAREFLVGHMGPYAVATILPLEKPENE